VAELRAPLDELGAGVGQLLALALQRAALPDELALVLVKALVLGGDGRDVGGLTAVTGAG
jgi:hypothetical protein